MGRSELAWPKRVAGNTRGSSPSPTNLAGDGAVRDEANPDNLYAFIDTAKTYR
jgi:hypothetical protein